MRGKKDASTCRGRDVSKGGGRGQEEELLLVAAGSGTDSPEFVVGALLGENKAVDAEAAIPVFFQALNQ
jgi:hypothetical protein